MDLDELRPRNSPGRDLVRTHVHHTRLSDISGLGGRGCWPPVHTLPGLLTEKTHGSLSEGFLETCGVQAGSVGLAKPPGVTQNRPQMRIGASEPLFPHPLVGHTGSRRSPGSCRESEPQLPSPVLLSKPHLSPSISFLYQLSDPLFRFLGNHLPKKASCLRVCFRGHVI